MKWFIVINFIFLLSCSDSKETIKIKGSDTEVNLAVQLAEDFHKVDAKLNISVSGGGSGLGIASLLNGQADIANSSRPLNYYEDSLFHKKNIELQTFIFAEDAIAFVVSKSCRLDTISAGKLAKVLSGDYDNWSSLTGDDMPINIYGRQSNSGTHDFVKQKLKIEFSNKAKEMNGNAQIIEAVKMDRSGIGYVGAGYVKSGLSTAKQAYKILSIAASEGDKAVSPLDSIAIKNNTYFFQRPLFQFIKNESMQKVSVFMSFEKSKAGLAIIKSAGYYPVINN